MSVSVGDSNILPSLKVRNLGVIFDECLTLDAHISNICRRAHFHLRNIGRIRMLLSFEASSQLIHALITTTLDYCNGILYNLSKHKIERLQRIQNQAARVLKRIPTRNHITPVLKDGQSIIRHYSAINTESNDIINERIEFKILILTHRAFYETGPWYLSELIKSRTLLIELDEPMIIVYCLFPLLVKCVPIVILNDHLVNRHLFCGID